MAETTIAGNDFRITRAQQLFMIPPPPSTSASSVSDGDGDDSKDSGRRGVATAAAAAAAGGRNASTLPRGFTTGYLRHEEELRTVRYLLENPPDGGDDDLLVSAAAAAAGGGGLGRRGIGRHRHSFSDHRRHSGRHSSSHLHQLHPANPDHPPQQPRQQQQQHRHLLRRLKVYDIPIDGHGEYTTTTTTSIGRGDVGQREEDWRQSGARIGRCAVLTAAAAAGEEENDRDNNDNKYDEDSDRPSTGYSPLVVPRVTVTSSDDFDDLLLLGLATPPPQLLTERRGRSRDDETSAAENEYCQSREFSCDASPTSPVLATTTMTFSSLSSVLLGESGRRVQGTSPPSAAAEEEHEQEQEEDKEEDDDDDNLATLKRNMKTVRVKGRRHRRQPPQPQQQQQTSSTSDQQAQTFLPDYHDLQPGGDPGGGGASSIPRQQQHPQHQVVFAEQRRVTSTSYWETETPSRVVAVAGNHRQNREECPVPAEDFLHHHHHHRPHCHEGEDHKHYLVTSGGGRHRQQQQQQKQQRRHRLIVEADRRPGESDEPENRQKDQRVGSGPGRGGGGGGALTVGQVDCCNRHHHHHHHRRRQGLHYVHNVPLAIAGPPPAAAGDSKLIRLLAATDPSLLRWDLPTPPSPPRKKPVRHRSSFPSPSLFGTRDLESDSSSLGAYYSDDDDDDDEDGDDEMRSKHWFILGLVILCTFGVGLGVGLPLALKRQLSLEERLAIVFQILKEVPLVDGHNDLPWNIRQFHHNQLQTVNLSADLRTVYPWNSSNWSHTDLHRLRQGGIGAQFWAAYAPCRTQDYNAVQMTIEQIDVIKRMVSSYPDHTRMAYSPAGIREVHKLGLTAGLIGIEGGHSLGNSLGVLRMMYDLGARYLTLTHNCDTPWAEADGTKDDYAPSLSPSPSSSSGVGSERSNGQRWNKRSAGGLSDFGKVIISEMNRLGMMVDLSHVSYATVRAVLDVARAPVLFTHSASRAVCNHSRNIPDDLLRDLARNGGIVMVPFYPDFVSCSRFGTVQNVIEHINHIRDVAGVDHVGIGSDFDGINRTIEGLEDVAKYPYLLAELLADGGWSADDLKKLAGENFLRVFDKVEWVRKEMLKTGLLPAEELIPLSDLAEITNCTYNGT